MSSENDVLLQMYAKAPSPIRDYYGIIITKDHVVLNIWNISHGPHTFPKKYKKHVSEFLDDRELQYHIENTFGTHVRDFVMGLAMKEYNLQYIPTKIFLKILKLLAARDIMNLSQTSKIFFKLCNTEKVWKIICRKQLKRSLTKQELLWAEEFGWKRLAVDKMQERRRAKSKAAILNNNSTIIIGTKNDNRIDFIKNVKPNAAIEKQKLLLEKKSTALNSKMVADPRKNIAKLNIKLENFKNVEVPKTGLEKNVSNGKLVGDRKNSKGKDNSKDNLLRQAKSTIMLESKRTTEIRKIHEKKINSVTDIINTVSSTRIRSSNVVSKNKNEPKKIK